MKTTRMTAAMSLATVAAAVSAIAMSSAHAGQPQDATINADVAAFTANIGMELDAKLQARDLPSPNETRLADQRLHDGRIRIAQAEPMPVLISTSASPALPLTTLN